MKIALLNLVFLTLGSFAFADSDCSFSLDSHPEVNLGYAVGNICSELTLTTVDSTKVKLINSNQGQCEIINSKTSNGTKTITVSFDVDKGSHELGASCQLQTTFADGSRRVVSIQENED